MTDIRTPLIETTEITATIKETQSTNRSETKQHKDMPMLKVFLLTNLCQILYTFVQSLTKDLLTFKNVTES